MRAINPIPSINPNNEPREMTLTEWCNVLPKDHAANKELSDLKERINKQDLIISWLTDGDNENIEAEYDDKSLEHEQELEIDPNPSTPNMGEPITKAIGDFL